MAKHFMWKLIHIVLCFMRILFPPGISLFVRHVSLLFFRGPIAVLAPGSKSKSPLLVTWHKAPESNQWLEETKTSQTQTEIILIKHIGKTMSILEYRHNSCAITMIQATFKLTKYYTKGTECLFFSEEKGKKTNY